MTMNLPTNFDFRNFNPGTDPVPDVFRNRFATAPTTSPTPIGPSKSSMPPMPAPRSTPISAAPSPSPLSPYGWNQPSVAQPWKPPFELNDLSDLLKQALAAQPAKQEAAPQVQQQQQQALTPQQQYGGTNYTSLMSNPYQSTFMPGSMRERQQTGLTMGRYF